MNPLHTALAASMNACWALVLLRIAGLLLPAVPAWPPLLAAAAAGFALRRPQRAAALALPLRTLLAITGLLAAAVLAGGWPPLGRDGLRALTSLPWPPAAVGLGFGGGSWLLGWRLASRRFSAEAALAEFQLGAVLLALLLFSSQRLGLPLAPLLPAAFAFLLLALTLLAASASRLDARSLPLLLLLLLLFIGGGWSAGRLLRPEPLHRGAAWLLAQGDRAQQWLVPHIQQWAEALASLRGQPLPAAERESGPAATRDGDVSLYKNWTLPGRIRAILRPLLHLIYLAGALVVVRAIAHAIALRLSRRSDGEAAPPGNFRQELWLLLRGLYLALTWLGRRLYADWCRYRRELALPPANRQAFHSYRNLRRWATRRGCRCEPWLTPAEFQQRLNAWRPEFTAEFAAIVQPFIRARYGPTPLPAGEAAAAAANWQRLRRRKRPDSPLR